MANPNIVVHPDFVAQLNIVFEEQIPKLPRNQKQKGWSGKFAYYIKVFIQEELYQYDPNLQVLMRYKVEKGFPDPKTVKRAFRSGEKNRASVDFLNVCGWYVYKTAWPTIRDSFDVLTYQLQQTYKTLKTTLQTVYTTDKLFTTIGMVGNTFDEIQELAMGKCYTGLSYLELKEVKERDDFIWKEKEKTAFKKYVNQNEVPHSIISQTVLSMAKSTAIMGNPGVGKSTFARWLCFHWATQKIDDIGIELPLYFNLRELELSNPTNPFTSYLVQKYLFETTINATTLQELLKTKTESVVFLLDGFDELEGKNRQQLAKLLYQYYPRHRFILLSRPYGLIDSPLKFDSIFEIIGFNALSRNNYVKEVFSLNQQVQQIQHLLDILQQNPVLQTNSFNPLMLSYIVLLYLLDGSHAKRLMNIGSTYELQDLVIVWLKKHHAKKIELTDDFNVFLEKAQQLAYRMEVQRTFLYDSKGSTDPNDVLCTQLNKIGVGRKYSFEIAAPWKYHFTSVTLQEFLASRHIGQYVTLPFFIELLQDNYFWNFSKMILGVKHFLGASNFIAELIQTLHQTAQQEANPITINHIALFIGECSTEQLNQVLSKSLLTDLLDNYVKFFADNGWRSIFLGSLQQMYPKLKAEKKQLFNGIVLEILGKIAIRDTLTDAEYITAKDYFPMLIRRLQLYKELDFANGLVRIIEQLLHTKNAHFDKLVDSIRNKYSGTGEEEAIVDAANQYGSVKQAISVSLFALAQQIPTPILDLHQSTIEAITEELQNDLEYTPSEIQLCSHFWSTQAIINTYQKYKADALKYLATYTTIPDEDIMDDIEICYYQIGTYAYAATLRKSELDSADFLFNLIEEAQDLVKQLYHQFIVPNGSATEVYERNQLLYTANDTHPLELIASAWLMLDEPKAIEKVFHILVQYRIEFYFKVNNLNEYEQWLSTFIHETLDIVNKPLEEAMHQRFLYRMFVIRIAFFYEQQGSFLAFKYLDTIFQLFEHLLKIYTTLEAEEKDEKTPNPLFEIVQKSIYAFTDILIYDHTKRKFIELFLANNLERYTFLFNLKFIDQLLTNKIIFFNDAIWDLCFQMLEEHKRLDIGIRILGVSTSYKVPSNFPHLCAIWTILFEHQPAFLKQHKKAIDTLLNGVYFTLCSILKNNTVQKYQTLILRLNRMVQQEICIQEVLELHKSRTLNHEEVMPYFLLEYILGISNEISQKGLDYYCLPENMLHVPIGIDLVDMFSVNTAMNFGIPHNTAVLFIINMYLAEKGKVKAITAKDFDALFVA